MFSIPFGSVITDIQPTGSAAIDTVGRLAIALYDLLGDVGSSTLSWDSLTGSLQL